MPAHPKITRECPSLENTVFVDSYKSQYPARYSSEDDDKHVLHAGGHGYRVFESSLAVHLDPQVARIFESPVTLFVLNSIFVIWSDFLNHGLEIPYTLIALHALKEMDSQLVLYLQILPCLLFTLPDGPQEVGNFDIVIRTEDAEFSLQTKLQSPSLFAKNSTMPELYCALSTCSALHYDSDSESNGLESPAWITKNSDSQLEVPTHWINSGVADDLVMDSPFEDQLGEAGMNIDVGETAVIGVRRRNSDAFNA